MKNFIIFGVHRKNRILRGVHEKPMYRGIAWKGGTWTVSRFKEGLSKKEGGGVFEGGSLPQCTLWTNNILAWSAVLQ